MRKLPYPLYRWISRNNHNLFLVALITFSFPELFLKSIYQINSGNQKRWKDRLACFTPSFDCDFPQDVEAIPGILKRLKQFPFKASFACVGYWIEKYPDIHKMILDYGHEIINHTYSHPDNDLINPDRKFRECSYEEKKEELVRCHDVCMKLIGCEPIGSRIPHFKHNFGPDIYEISAEIGYQFSSSTWLTNTCSAGLPFRAGHDIVEFPVSTCPKHPFTVFDTWHSLNTKRWSHKIIHRGEADFERLFVKLIQMGADTNSYINIYIDPADVTRIKNFYNIINQLRELDVDVVTYEEYLGKYAID